MRFDYVVCKIGEADQIKLVIYSADPQSADGAAFIAASAAASA